MSTGNLLPSHRAASILRAPPHTAVRKVAPLPASRVAITQRLVDCMHNEDEFKVFCSSYTDAEPRDAMGYPDSVGQAAAARVPIFASC